MAAFEEPADQALSDQALSLPEPARAVVPEVRAAGIGTGDRFARLRAELAEAVASAELAVARKEVEKWQAIADERDRALERADFALQAFATALTADKRGPDVGSVTHDVSTASRELAAASRELAAASRAVTERAAEPASAPPAPAAAEAPSAAPAPAPAAAPAPAPPIVVYPPRHAAPTVAPLEAAAPMDGPDDVVEIPPYLREEAERYAQTMQALQDFKMDKARPRRWWQFWR
jgi:hypothetical protein